MVAAREAAGAVVEPMAGTMVATTEAAKAAVSVESEGEGVAAWQVAMAELEEELEAEVVMVASMAEVMEAEAAVATTGEAVASAARPTAPPGDSVVAVARAGLEEVEMEVASEVTAVQEKAAREEVQLVEAEVAATGWAATEVAGRRGCTPSRRGCTPLDQDHRRASARARAWAWGKPSAKVASEAGRADTGRGAAVEKVVRVTEGSRPADIRPRPQPMATAEVGPWALVKMAAAWARAVAATAGAAAA